MARCIMIVDDDLDDIALFQEALLDIDPTLICASAVNGMDAFRRLESAEINPDLIFVDMNMPILNGKDFIKLIREHKIFNRIKLFLYSTADMSNSLHELKSIGANGFIRKPTVYAELFNGLSDAIYDCYKDHPA